MRGCALARLWERKTSPEASPIPDQAISWLIRCWAAQRWTVAVTPCDSPVAAGSSRHALVQEGEHVGLPGGDAPVREAVPVVRSSTDWRIDLDAVGLAEPRHLVAQGLRRRDGVVV